MRHLNPFPDQAKTTVFPGGSEERAAVIAPSVSSLGPGVAGWWGGGGCRGGLIAIDAFCT